MAIQISRFRPVFGEVVFSEMTAEDPEHPALIGYTVLEQAGIIVDLVGHRLVRVPHYDFKSAVC